MNKRPMPNVASVLATYQLLREVCIDPKNFADDRSLVEALVSQGKLAKYDDAARKIRPMSLNTFKSAAEECDEIRGGFALIDKFRRDAASAIEKCSLEVGPELLHTGTAKTRALRELRNRNMTLTASNLVLLNAIGRLLKDLADIADTASTPMRKRLQSESEIRAHTALSANSPPFDSLESASLTLTKS